MVVLSYLRSSDVGGRIPDATVGLTLAQSRAYCRIDCGEMVYNDRKNAVGPTLAQLLADCKIDSGEMGHWSLVTISLVGAIISHKLSQPSEGWPDFALTVP